MSMVERDLANHDAALAAKVQVLPGMDVRLTFIDAAAGEDKYHVLQGLKDPTTEGDAKCCYFYQRSGNSGQRGDIHVDGPMLQPSLAIAMANVFKDKTGADWGEMKPGDRAPPGKYWVLEHSTPDLSVKWEYYVSDGVDGKKVGWYPYEKGPGEEVEELYAQHVANSRESRTATRVIKSDYFTYLVDLTKMTQQNQKTRKVRTIRRADGTEEDSVKAPARAMKAVMKAARVKVMKSASKESLKVKRSASKDSLKSMKAAAKKSGMKVMKASMKKAMKLMKVMKAMKKKKVSKVGSKSQVLKGQKIRTKGGVKASDLMKNKKGKVVFKKLHARGKKAYEKNLAKWCIACSQARKELGLTGFVAVKKGSDFYNKAKSLMSS